MITEKEAKVLDRNSEYFGVPTLQLMENAGKAVAEFIKKILQKSKKKILIFCGTGNNGGDGFVAARYLAPDCPVSIVLARSPPKTDHAKKNYQKLPSAKVKIYTNLSDVDHLLNDHDVIIDALLGIGMTGDLKEPYATLVKKIQSKKEKIVISVDIPTGFGTSQALIPHHTITFHDVKEGMNEQNSGQIHIVDIGIPPEAITDVGPGELSVYYPRPAKKSHKGENGVVLIIGGGPYIGAPALSGLAALRSGVDLVYIATPKRSWESIAAFSPNFIVTDLHSDVLTKTDIPVIKKLLDKCTAVILGPGLGNAKETEEAVPLIVKRVIQGKKPLVIDADAIKPISEHITVLKQSLTVITPHVGEFKKLTGIALSQDIDERTRIVHEWARTHEIALFQKGYIDILTNGKNMKLNKVHNEAMTVGGTGDVLAGIIGALLSKGVTPFQAICMAAFLNGSAGNLAFQKKSYGLMATDIVEELPTVLKKYL